MAAKLANARGETVAEKPAFRSAFRRMRCLIPADANALVRPVHDRMPVILQPADYAAWLDTQTKAEDFKSLLKPLPEDLMERYRVSRRMGNARNEGEACMAPRSRELTFFATRDCVGLLNVCDRIPTVQLD